VAGFGKALEKGLGKALDPGHNAKLHRAAASAFGLSMKGGKAAGYRVGQKVEMYTIPGGFARGSQGRRRAVPRKPEGKQAMQWYKSIGGRAGYEKLYKGTAFGKYRQGRVDYRAGKKGQARQRTSGAILKGELAGLYSKLGIPGAHIGGGKAPRRAASRKGAKSRRGGLRGGLAKHAALYEQLLAAGRIKGPMNKFSYEQLAAVAEMNPVSALANVSALGNPSFEGVSSWFTGWAVPVYVGAGVTGGALHGVAAAFGVTSRVEGLVRKVPFVGNWVADNATHSVQGVLVGALLGALSPVAARYVSPRVGGLLASAGAGAVVGGGIIDAYSMTQRYFGGEQESEYPALVAEAGDSTGALAFGDLAFERGLGDLAFERGLGDLAFAQANPVFNAASLSAPSPLGGDDLGRLYSQASFADAFYSGADFSGAEGEALLNGSQAWCNSFGNPTVRMAGRNPKGPSHLAGQEGHRWGWLIAAVGSDRARKICALPPAQRLRVILQLRRAAIKAYQRAMLESQAIEAEEGSADPELLPAAGAVANGAMGAVGAGAPNMDYLGDPVVFMGA
jgi:hypothetical protein